MKYMKILIHMGDSYPDGGPNANRIRTFCEVFKERGHSVIIMAPKYEKSMKTDSNFCYCKAPPLKNKSNWNRLMNQLGFGVTSLFKSPRVGKADVVITTSPPALISPFGWMIAKLKRAKLVYDVRDIWPDVAWEMGSFDRHSAYSRIFVFVRNFMLKHADLITTVSKGKVQKLQNYKPKADVLYITNGLDEHFLENEEKLELVRKYQLHEIFSCVYIGNLGLAQGLMQLMHVAEKAKENGLHVQFLLYGSGAEEDKLKKYTEENKLNNVLFPGIIPNDDVYTILKYSSMCFVSLVNDKLTDSIPTKLYEALGAGCPVLLAAAGESVSLLEECGLGIAVAPNDEESLWKAFLSMYENMSGILRFRDQAKKIIIEKYSRQKAALQLEQELTKRYEH